MRGLGIRKNIPVSGTKLTSRFHLFTLDTRMISMIKYDKDGVIFIWCIFWGMGNIFFIIRSEDTWFQRITFRKNFSSFHFLLMNALLYKPKIRTLCSF